MKDLQNEPLQLKHFFLLSVCALTFIFLAFMLVIQLQQKMLGRKLTPRPPSNPPSFFLFMSILNVLRLPVVPASQMYLILLIQF